MTPSRGDLILSVPSKTFLLGEYAVLNGGTAIVVGSYPRFQLRVRMGGESGVEGIHPQSPAGQWLRKSPERFKDCSIRFNDPHEGRGGFGASSAQFLLVYAFSQMARDSFAQMALDPQIMWQAYRELNHGEGQAPSGADVLAQLMGQVSIVNTTPVKVTARTWPFENLKVLFFATGYKVSTHEHLRERLPVSDLLLEQSARGEQAFQNVDEFGFLRAMRNFADELERLQLVTAETRGLIAEVSAHGALAVKGCGALGADVLAVAVRPDDESVESYLKSRGLRCVASTDHLCDGLKVEIELAPVHREPDAFA